MSSRDALRSLVRSWGIQPSYTDAAGRRRAAPEESVLTVLRSLGAPVERVTDAAAALAERTSAHWRRGLDPVAVAWEGSGARVALRLPERGIPPRLGCCIELEDGDVLQQRFPARDMRPRDRTVVDGESFVELELSLGPHLPQGYHRLVLDTPGPTFETTLIVAPRLAHDAADRAERDWGVFLPLHALHGPDSWGAGSYADLARLVDWTADEGGRVVGTLPLLPSYLDRPFDPSPYMPVSRLLWSDLHVTAEAVPEMASSAGALRKISRRLSRLRGSGEVDYRRQQALQRSVLEPLAAGLLARPSPRGDAWHAFRRAHPHVADYARFRAVVERTGRAWSEWPERLRDGRFGPGDFDASSEAYHSFAQWLAADQLGAVAQRARERGVRLYLDVPLGSHPAGYDVWRNRNLFASRASAGAPPDPFFTRGQNWCFPPVRPEQSRAEAHRYFAGCLRHHMSVAGMVRLDHVMSLHRLFWIPDGFDAGDGVYVSYPAEELHAIVCLESRRNGCVVVGEDLGTVPRQVRPAMRRHGMRRTFVLQYGRGSNPRRPLESLRIEGVASLRTHDMPTFAAFWRALDVGRRVRLGHLTRPAARREREARRKLLTAWQRDLRRGGWLTERDPATAAALEACLAFLADSKAETVLVDLEDLWGETEPHNVPGTTTEEPNWRRRARYSLEEFAKLPRVRRALDVLRQRRTGGGE